MAGSGKHHEQDTAVGAIVDRGFRGDTSSFMPLRCHAVS